MSRCDCGQVIWPWQKRAYDPDLGMMIHADCGTPAERYEAQPDLHSEHDEWIVWPLDEFGSPEGDPIATTVGEHCARTIAAALNSYPHEQLGQERLFDVRACSKCGCTDDDCSGCIERTGSRCWWVEHDLCSACETESTAAMSAPDLSPEERAEVERFGLDKPEIHDDVEGVEFGFVLVLGGILFVALVIAAVVAGGIR